MPRVTSNNTCDYTVQFKIVSRFDGSVIFAAEIECEPNAAVHVKLGLAIRAAVLAGANLRDAYLRGADLRGADLRGAYLSDANLRDADLRDADLRGAYLSDADLRDADLRGADLRGAYLSDADLRDADLRGAYLRGASLTGAYLRGADLRGADMRWAYLTGADKINRCVTAIVRSDGYEFRAYLLQDGTVKIVAGCRYFSPAEYREHIAREYPGTSKAEETLAIIEHIEREAAASSICTSGM